jgi:hypothetical protein
MCKSCHYNSRRIRSFSYVAVIVIVKSMHVTAWMCGYVTLVFDEDFDESLDKLAYLCISLTVIVGDFTSRTLALGQHTCGKRLLAGAHT